PKGKARAKAAWSGDFATFYEHYNGYGQNFNINSGYQQPDLGRFNCILWFCSNFNNMISSVRTHGTSAVLYDHEGFYGDVYVVGPNQLKTSRAGSTTARRLPTTPGAGSSVRHTAARARPGCLRRPRPRSAAARSRPGRRPPLRAS